MLSVGDRSENVRIVEVSTADAELVLRAWPSFVPQGVEMMCDAGVVADTTPDALTEVVGVCPVFRLDAMRRPPAQPTGCSKSPRPQPTRSASGPSPQQ